MWESIRHFFEVLWCAITSIFGGCKPDEPEDPQVPSRTEPTKRALLVGIDDYTSAFVSDLSGPVNDVIDIRDLLIEVYGFDADSIRVLCNYRASRDEILDRLHWLIDEAMSGDELVFHYSGHGSQVRDRNGDELDDHMDEILCPADYHGQAPYLKDDDIADIFKKLPQGAYLTMICDACHSGSMSREFVRPEDWVDDEEPQKMTRYSSPPVDIVARSEGRTLDVSKMGMKQVPGMNGWLAKSDDQRHVLLSGCKDDQVSWSAILDGYWHGALSHALVKTLRENPDLTWVEAQKKVIEHIYGWELEQDPQLSGSPELINRKVFGKE